MNFISLLFLIFFLLSKKCILIEVYFLISHCARSHIRWKYRIQFYNFAFDHTRSSQKALWSPSPRMKVFLAVAFNSKLNLFQMKELNKIFYVTPSLFHLSLPISIKLPHIARSKFSYSTAEICINYYWNLNLCEDGKKKK